jgi:hypothetical protein
VGKGDITTNTSEIQRIIWEYFKNLCSNKLEHVEEMDKFLDTDDQPILDQEDIDHLNEIEAAMKSFPKQKSPRPNGFTVEFY